MRKRLHLWAWVLAAAAAVVVAPGGRPAMGQDAEQQKKIEQLIKDLGAADFATREAAEKALVELGPDAMPALQQAAKSDDPEMATRAKHALAALTVEISKRTHRLLDAEGNPLVGVSAVLTDFDFATNTHRQVAKARVDAWGYVSFPQASGRGNYWITVAHKELGRARAQQGHGAEAPADMVFALLSRTSPAFERAAKGQVVGDNGKPVADAVISCREIRTPGEGLITPRETIIILTDEQGRFSMYGEDLRKAAVAAGRPPEGVAARPKKRGKLIPPNSTYHLEVRPPAATGLFPRLFACRNSGPATIVLQRPTMEHVFRFEKADGGFFTKQDAQWPMVNYALKGRRQRINLDRALVREGGKLMPGVYTASVGQQDYLPVEVKKGSARELVFRLPPPVSYRGKVVDGLTGKGVAGAFVMGMSGVGNNNIALVTEDQWTMLEKLPEQPPPDDPTPEQVLGRLYGFCRLVRTEADGSYELVARPGQEVHALLAFARNRLPYKHRTYKLEAGADGITPVPDLPLFPAGKVLVEPVMPRGRVSLGHHWILEKEGQPEWIEALRKAGVAKRYPDAAGFERLHWMQLNKPQPLYVPAGVKMRLAVSTPYDDNWTAVAPPGAFVVKEGQTRDLGRITFVPSARVVVKVVGPDERPLEGIPLRRRVDGSNTWNVAHNTDSNGEALFFAPPGSAGKIAVRDFPDREAAAAKAGNITVRFKLDEAAEPRPCVIKLTQEQMNLLLDRPAKSGGVR